MWVKLLSGSNHTAEGKNGKRQQMWSPRSWENWPECSQCEGRNWVNPIPKRWKDHSLLHGNPHTTFPHRRVWRGKFMQQNCFGWEHCKTAETLLCLFKHLPQPSLRWRLPQIPDCRIWAVLRFLRDCLEQLVFLYFPVKGSVRHLLKQTNPRYFSNLQAALPSSK